MNKQVFFQLFILYDIITHYCCCCFFSNLSMSTWDHKSDTSLRSVDVPLQTFFLHELPKADWCSYILDVCRFWTGRRRFNVWLRHFCFKCFQIFYLCMYFVMKVLELDSCTMKKKISWNQCGTDVQSVGFSV